MGDGPEVVKYARRRSRIGSWSDSSVRHARVWGGLPGYCQVAA